MFQVPPDGFAKAGFKRVRRMPAEFPLDLGRVNGVTAVMAGPVLDERDELARTATQLRRHFVDLITDPFHNGQVRPLVVAANIVSLPIAPAGERQPTRLRMIADKKPVPDIQAVAVDGTGPAGERILEDHRDEFLGE